MLGSLAGAQVTTDHTRYVNAFIGTEGSVPGTAFNGGNVFPGAAVPFGAVKVSSAVPLPCARIDSSKVGIDTTA